MTIANIHQLFLNSNGVCTDTRNIIDNSIFFALKGERFNANTFANQALEQGASYAIIDEKKYVTSEKYILVDNVLQTLQQLASYHRQYLKIPIVALTGSNGKTTTKELIYNVLSTKYNTVATVGNLNNHIGVPLTLLSMNSDTELGIVEMGANHLEEIDFLCSITLPDYGYITNIGKAHLEGFGGLEGVLKGKTELYRHLQKQEKLIFVNADDPKLLKASKEMKTFTFSEFSKSDLHIKLLQANPMVSVEFDKTIINSNLIGTYNFSNISAAISIGNYFSIETDHIKNAIESYNPSNNRSQIIKKNNNTIILDAYNANPSSMKAAIDNFKQLDYSSKCVFLGDMFELGKEAAIEHQSIADLICTTDVNSIFLIGENFEKTITSDSRITKYKSYEDLKNHWDSNSDALKDVILIKGSRGMKLERILDLI
ncbi:UDP-N-acetylmuramoyl-tripeptide--D-alanyl-D-alanine ligase [Aquimarina sp. 2201CG5-10]|uniref:UDP-N-acetylmuramoyl-tripeptide--D-alanyl-D- alanine ligase n=1 Tax=Aquimarina callyspongiae TaxID=3098150 RepID=UPI002AB51B0C|nr:UDP-N-acetylmuramoyl-tripeptide--D-alanyl-D-alanine ligase [Aquimarina sp. 2201CG5-10]MDY8134530.1 UDP-N-acetylmuramoyl-tripeptide--D-alanyl-D-alanine ligase [Aquimarina sp. 2201CG5-10]